MFSQLSDDFRSCLIKSTNVRFLVHDLRASLYTKRGDTDAARKEIKVLQTLLTYKLGFNQITSHLQSYHQKKIVLLSEFP